MCRPDRCGRLNVEEADAPIAGLCLLDRNGLADQGVRHMNEAIEAEDGPSGLKVLRGGARIDLLVTDVGLPGGTNGRQMADAARVLRPGRKCCSSPATPKMPWWRTAASTPAWRC